MWWWGGRVLAGVLLLSVTAARSSAAPIAPATVLFDPLSGRILQETRGDAVYDAGSLYQLMVLLLTLEQAELGAMQLEVPVTISQSVAAVRKAAVHAASPGGVPLALSSQRPYLLSDLLKAALVTGSDVATMAVAEAVHGSVANCVDAMNARAERLGLQATHFHQLNSESSSPDTVNTTTARDVARLSQALLEHSQVVDWASLNGLPFDDGSALLRNANPLVGRVAGVEGLHVGAASGGRTYHAVISAVRGPLHLAVVVLGAPDGDARFRSAMDLLEWGFARFERVDVVKRGDRLNVGVAVEGGAAEQVTPIAGATFSVLRQRGEERNFELRYQLPTTVTAPVQRDEPIGEIIIEEHGQLVAVIPALSNTTVPAIGVVSASLR